MEYQYLRRLTDTSTPALQSRGRRYNSPCYNDVMDDGSSTIIGRGRSGTVFRMRDGDGCDHTHYFAHKRFHCRGLTRLVHLIVFGCVSPYVWCAQTVQAAVLRRQILGELVAFWMKRRLRVAEVRGLRWSSRGDGDGAYALETEWIDGRHAALHQPFRDGGHDEARNLYRNVMRPLQRCLAESGFDGLMWQVGLGNPVAANNFLLEYDGTSGHRWVWIDLESGVPALFAINPLSWVRFYLPRSWRHRGAMLDDVDIQKLRGYVDERMAKLRRQLGADRCEAMLRRIDALADCQNPWRRWRRVDRSIQCRLKLGHIDATAARWYSAHPFVWYGREMIRGARSGLCRVAEFADAARHRLAAVNVAAMCGNIAIFICSQQYRAAAARRYLVGRIDRWHQRGQLADHESAMLRHQIEADEAGPYITDFGVHLLTKPVAKVTAYLVVPYLVAVGALDAYWLAIAVLFSGPAVRTLYTSGRFIQAVLRRAEKPWIALFAGIVPMLGNVAYPLQIVYAGTGRDRQAARFILYDTFSRVGENLPIWGGCDTFTEHLFNRIADLAGRREHDRYLGPKVEPDAAPKSLASSTSSRNRLLVRNAG